MVQPHSRSTYDTIVQLYPKLGPQEEPEHGIRPKGPFPSSLGDIRLDNTGGVQAQAPYLDRNWEGLGGDEWVPGDPSIAVGPYNMIVAINDDWAIYNKHGDLLYHVDMNDWFGDSNQFTDPQCIYDPWVGRFVFSVLEINKSAHTAYWVVCVSDDNNAVGSWWWYYFDCTYDGGNKTDNFGDYPGLGFDNQALYITGNQYKFGGSFQESKLRILDKSKLYAGASAGYYDFWGFTDDGSTPSWTLRPAQEWSSPGFGVMVNAFWASTNYVVLWKINSPLSGPSVSGQKVSCSTYSPPPSATQQGSSSTLDTLDSRLLNAFYLYGEVYAGQTVAYDWGAGNLPVIKYYKINVFGPTLDWEQMFGNPGFNYWFPAVAANNLGDMGVVFARSSPSEDASIRFSGRRSADTGLQGSAVMRQGDGYYNYFRWGDYFGIGLDPSDAQTFWMYGMYGSSSNYWNTYVGEANFDRGPDTTPPSFLGISPNQTTNQAPQVVGYVQDTGTGLYPPDGYYRYSADDGNNWSGWYNVGSTGGDGTTAVESITTAAIPYNQDSMTQNLIQFAQDDMSRNWGYSPLYTVQIDSTPPTPWGPPGPVNSLTPNVYATIADATSGLNVGSAQYWYSKDAGASYSGPFGASCSGSNGTTATQTVGATNVPFNQETLTQNAIWFRIVDMFGNASGSGWMNVPTDATPPGGWKNFAPSGTVNGGAPTCTVQVRDTLAGLYVEYAYYNYSTDGGSTWHGWQNTPCSGSDGSTSFETVTANSVQFNHHSLGTDNQIQFAIFDVFGNLSYSAVYVVRIDQVVTLSGKVTLEEFVGNPAGMSIMFKLFNSGTLIETETTTLAADGSYTVGFNNSGGTHVWGKPAHHLSYRQAKVLANGANSLDWDFVYNGDGTGDNKVNLPDLSLCLSNFNLTNADGDYDGNGKVGIADISIVLLNYNQAGS